MRSTMYDVEKKTPLKDLPSISINSDKRKTGRPGSSEVPRNPLTRWDVSTIPANGIFSTKKLKNKNKNAQRVEND